MSDQLFDSAAEETNDESCTDLVPFGLVCPIHSVPLVAYQECQPALFIHGGYGAARQTTWHQCSLPKCRFSVTTEIIEVNPREFW